MTPSIPVVVAGALGRMGAEVIKAVVGSADCTLVGAIDNTPGKEGSDIGLELGLGELEVAVTADFEGCLCAVSQSVRDEDAGAVLVISPIRRSSTSTPGQPLPTACIQ